MMINELYLVRNFVDWTGESEFLYSELDLTFTNVLVLFAYGLFGNCFGAPCRGSKGESTLAAERTCG